MAAGHDSTSISPVLSTAIISLGTAVSKVFGFAREIVIAAFFGASHFVDAYLVALLIPQALFSVIGGALTTTVIPLITEYEQRKGRQSVLTLLNTVTLFMSLGVVLIILIGESFTPSLVNIVAPGFSGETEALAISLSRIMLPIMLFLGLTDLGSGILQSQRRFLYPAFIGIPYNIFIIASILVIGRIWGITGLALGTLLGVISQWVFQIPDLRKNGFPFKWEYDFSHPGFKKMGGLIVPVLIGSSAGQINFIVDRIMASGLVEGSISALNYATKLNLMIYALIAVALANAIYPELAEAAVMMDKSKFRNSLLRSMNGLMLVVIPITIGTIIMRGPLVRLVYERGAFDSVAAELTAIALFFFSFGLPALCLREIILRAFYSLQDTMTPMIIGIVTIALNITLILLLVPYLALGGLALATSISVSLSILLLLYYLRKKLDHIGGRILLVTGGKIVLAALVMGIIVYCSYGFMDTIIPPGTKKDLAILTANTIIGGVVYFITVYILRVEELGWLMNKAKLKFGS